MIHDSNNLISITWRGTCLVIMKQFSPMSVVKNFYEPSTSKYRNRFSMKQLQLYGFLLLVLLPSTMSIPLRGKRSSTDKLARSDEKTPWVNPCAGASTEAKYENNCTENIFFGSVIQSGKLAIYDAKQFVENYVNETFNVNLEDHHNQFKKNSLPWLKPDNVEIPKELGEVVSQEHLKKLKLEDVAVDIYEYLQHMAVAFRQVVEDHREQNSKFKENFSTAETSLKALLREMREFIPESKLALFDNAKQEIMPPTYRHMKDHTFKPVRDWLIFRDYMNLVEYIVQVMEYFVKKIEIVD